jgi:hypothetical protein
MQKGDLVRVRNLSPVAAVHHGKVGVVVAVHRVDPRASAHSWRRWRYDVLLDGGIAHFYEDYLELVDEAR